ncbi:MAG: hypothetical protein HS128_19110 [Ideonella sp.]|nr:hypothetical protein [Ideonella sp.]MCC7456000.1 hypothetical protein [Nitrospira sp.]
MSPLDLIRSRGDGSMSLTKLAALVAHALAAVLFVRLQWSAPFNRELWLIYLGVAILHASYDKTAAILQAAHARRLEGLGLEAGLASAAPAATAQLQAPGAPKP